MINFCHKYKARCLSDVGLARTSNQDEIIELPEFNLFTVSDGMGGLINGGETSALVKRWLPKMIGSAVDELTVPLSIQHAEEILKEKIRIMNSFVFDAGEGSEGRFGATLCGVWLVSDSAVFFNVGDSRGYVYRDNELKQITKDHNLAAHLVERGELTKDEARNHQANSRLLRFIGMKEPIKADIFVEKVKPDDKILLCSDGLHGMLADDEIVKVLSENGNTAKMLVDAANKNGGKDNIAVVYIVIRR